MGSSPTPIADCYRELHFKQHKSEGLNKQITCKQCGKIFEPNVGNQMYCSQQCLNVVGIRHMTWYDDVLDKDRYVMYIPYDPTIEEKMYEKACDYFGVEYEQESCLIDAFFRQHPECTTACISCSCPKCSPRC